MDVLLLSGNEKATESLQYGVPPSSAAVLNRNKVSFAPSGASSFSNSSRGLVRFNLGSQHWLDWDTVSVQFKITSGDTNLMPVPQPWAHFQRCRILSKGQVITDVDNFARTYEKLSLTQSKTKRNADISKGVMMPLPYEYNTVYPIDGVVGFNAGMFQTLSFNLSKILKSSTLLPLHYLDLTVELEMLSDSTGALLSLSATDNAPITTIGGAVYTLSDFYIRGDACQLDTAYENAFTERLLDGNSLNISLVNTVSIMQNLTGDDMQIQFSRSISKLKKMLISYQGTPVDGRSRYYTKQFCEFLAPRSNIDANPTKPENGVIKLQVGVGSELFPSYPITSNAEAFEQLAECFGNDLAMNTQEYYSDRFIFGLNFDKLHDVNFSGMSLKNKQVVVHSKITQAIARMHIVLQYDCILEVNDASVTLFE